MMRFLFIILLSGHIHAQVDTIGFLGDSHCNGGFGVGDSNWISRMTKTYQDARPGTVAYKFCSGGETIKTNMPLRYPGAVNGKSIDNALAAGVDIFFFLQSGNHVAFDIPQDTSKWCYQKIADTLSLLGKHWAFSTIGPRQNTYTGSMNFTRYNAQRDSLNAWLYATFPGHVFSLDTLLDRTTNKPKAALLLSDSLHYGPVGHRYMWQTNMHDVAWVDSTIGYDIVRAVNMRFTASAVTFSGSRVKYISVYGSNDGSTFTRVSYTEFTGGVSFPVSGYQYVKVVMQNYNKTITVTKRFI